MNTNRIDQAFVRQLEELNREAGTTENNDWLSPVFIEAYQARLEEKIRRSRVWAGATVLLQLPFLVFLLFYNKLAAWTGIYLDRNMLLSLVIILMVLFSTLAGRRQRKIIIFEKQLLLITTYKEITTPSDDPL